MAYSNQQKALAIQVMRRHGGMTIEALEMIAELFGGKAPSTSTLHDWLKRADKNSRNETETKTEIIVKKEARNVVPQRVFLEADRAVEDLLAEVAQTYLLRALDEEVVKALKGQQAVTAAAIAIDKLRLLQGLPTEIVGIMPDFVQVCLARGVDPAVVLREIMVQVRNAE